jgi:hypothetical protein
VQTFTYGVSGELYANTYTRTGCSFAGWATSAGGPVVYLDKAVYTPVAADITLYPVWNASGAISVSLDPAGTDDVDFSGSFSVAKGESLSIGVTNTGLHGFKWYFDGASVSGQTRASFSLATSTLVAGPHSLMIVASDATGMQYSVSMTVRITN